MTRRCELAVTLADPDRIVVLAGATDNGGGLCGVVYQSFDAENHLMVNPNILGWSEDPGDGGQYYYDLAFVMSADCPRIETVNSRPALPLHLPK